MKFIKIKSERLKYWGVFTAGCLWGIGLALIVITLFLRYNLVEEFQCAGNFDESVNQLVKSVGAVKGWSMEQVVCSLPNTSDNCRMRTFKLCNAQYAKAMLNDQDARKVSSVIPCTFSIYEKQDGKTYISRLNVRVLGFIMGGIPGRIFPQNVNPEQKKILENIIK